MVSPDGGFQRQKSGTTYGEIGFPQDDQTMFDQLA